MISLLNRSRISKKICNSFLGLLFTCMLMSCNQSKAIKIGYLNRNAENEMAKNIMSFFKEKASGYDVEVVEKDAQNNEKTQYSQSMELIDGGAKVLVIKPVNTVLAADIVRYAHKKGVKVIANDQLIKNCPLDYYVTFDSRKVGELMATEALKYKPKGTYVILSGDKIDDNADLVKEGVYKVLQSQINNGNIKVLYSSYIEAWSLENSVTTMDMIVRLSGNQPIDAVIAASDDIARGAVMVLEKENMLVGVFISGQNADVETLKSIADNKQTVTLAKSPKTLGYALAELAVKIATRKVEINIQVNGQTNNGYQDVPSVLFDPVVVDKTNIANFIKKSGN